MTHAFSAHVSPLSCFKREDQFENQSHCTDPDHSWKYTDLTQFKKEIMAPQIVLISGCSSGIGLATAVLLAKDAEKNFKVYATMRNLAKKGQLEEEGKEQLGDTLIIKQMDVSSDESVRRLLKKSLTLKGKLMCCVSVLLRHLQLQYLFK